MSLINNLGKLSILTEAPNNNDDLFDIDKEVDAQIKRVEKRVAKSQAQEAEANQVEEEAPEQDMTADEQPEEDVTPDENAEEPTDSTEENPEDTTIDDQEEDPNLDTSEADTGEEDADMSSDETNIPDDYEPKQTIPELKILSSLSDREYKLCNIKILENFQELKKNVANTINNLIPCVTLKNIRQRQVIDIVKKNLYNMLEDIDNYVVYRNNSIYEENVRAYLTYLKRYQIATNLIKLILEENIKDKEEENNNKK